MMLKLVEKLKILEVESHMATYLAIYIIDHAIAGNSIVRSCRQFYRTTKLPATPSYDEVADNSIV